MASRREKMKIEELLESLTFHADYAPVAIVTAKDLVGMEETFSKEELEQKPKKFGGSKDLKKVQDFLKTFEKELSTPLVHEKDFAERDEFFKTHYFGILNSEALQEILNVAEKKRSNYIFANRLIDKEGKLYKVPSDFDSGKEVNEPTEDVDVVLERMETFAQALKDIEQQEEDRKRRQEEEALLEKQQEEEMSLIESGEEPFDDEVEDNQEETTTDNDLFYDDEPQYDDYEASYEDDYEEEPQETRTSQNAQKAEDFQPSDFSRLSDMLDERVTNELIPDAFNQSSIDELFENYHYDRDLNRSNIPHESVENLVNTAKSTLYSEQERANNELSVLYYERHDDILRQMMETLQSEMDKADLRTNIRYENLYSNRLNELEQERIRNEEEIKETLEIQRGIREQDLKNKKEAFVEQAKIRAEQEFDEAHEGEIEEYLDKLRLMYEDDFNRYSEEQQNKVYEDADKDYFDSLNELPDKIINKYREKIDQAKQEIRERRQERQEQLNHQAKIIVEKTANGIGDVIQKQIIDMNDFDGKEKRMRNDYEHRINTLESDKERLNANLKDERKKSKELTSELKDTQKQLKSTQNRYQKSEEQLKVDFETVSSAKNELNLEVNALRKETQDQQQRIHKLEEHKKKGMLNRNINIFGSVVAICLTIGVSSFFFASHMGNQNQSDSYVTELQKQNDKLSDSLDELKKTNESSQKELSDVKSQLESEKQENAQETTKETKEVPNSLAVGSKVKVMIDDKEQEAKIKSFTDGGAIVEKGKVSAFVPYNQLMK